MAEVVGMARRVVVDKDMGYAKILKNIAHLDNLRVLVGIREQAKTGTASKRGRTSEPGLSIAEYGAKNEFGSGNIPERSFMRNPFDKNLEKLTRFSKKEYLKAIMGEKDSVQALNTIGSYMQSLIQERIRDIITPPNSPVTIAIKKSGKPLIDYGFLINSITYTVRRKREEN